MFRTTPFPAFADNARAQAAKMGMYLKAPGSPASDDKDYVPPVSTMAIIGYTHTQGPLPPPTDPFKPNDNIVISPFSGFWGGAITDNIGAFAQVTYGGPPAGGFADPFGHTWGWDNTDVRFVKTVSIGGVDAIFGITANNNPTVQDLWNTTPAWAFPYASSTIAGTPSEAPSSRAHSRPMSPVSAPTPTSTTSSIWRPHSIEPSISGPRIRWASIPTMRPG